MSKLKKELLRLVAAAGALAVAITLSTGPSTLSATTVTGYCIHNDNHYCVSTKGAGAAYNYSCDAGACESCHQGGGRCDPYGSGVNIEGYWPN